MKVVFHESYRQVYAYDPAAKAGRTEVILEALKEYELVTPQAAGEQELLLVHARSLVDSVKKDPALFEIACLAAGGAIKAAEISLSEPAFGLIRPPGHHAGRHFNGGFCYFNNMAIAIQKLIADKKISRALIVDIDLHYGNGTEDIFGNREEIIFLNMECQEREAYLRELQYRLREAKEYDIVAVSAGFDTYEKDWGKSLKTQDYSTIGRMIKEAAQHCQGRRFALLEGGYYLPDLGKNVRSFLEGLS